MNQFEYEESMIDYEDSRIRNSTVEKSKQCLWIEKQQKQSERDVLDLYIKDMFRTLHSDSSEEDRIKVYESAKMECSKRGFPSNKATWYYKHYRRNNEFTN